MKQYCPTPERGLRARDKTSVPKSPSFPHPVDEHEATNPSLWQAVLDVAQGKRKEYTLGGRTIHAPNEGRGFYPWPHPNGSAWAVKQYNGFGGSWKGRKEAGLQDDLERKVLDILYGIPLDKPALEESDKARIADLAYWFRQNFRVDTAKTPQGQKRLKEEGARFLKILETNSQPGGTTYIAALKALLEIWDNLKGDIPELVKHFTSEGDSSRGKEEVLSEVKGQYATYFNRATMSNTNFKKYSKKLDTLFEGLRGWRKKALRGNLKVVFVGTQTMKVQGKYRRATDEMWVKATPKVLQRSSGYASPEYIIIHELGHRYEQFNPTGKDFDSGEWHTTRYSLNEGESFAELFALGHFDLRGSWNQDTMHRFESLMTGKEKTADSTESLRSYLLDGLSYKQYAEKFKKLSNRLAEKEKGPLTPQQEQILDLMKTGAIITTGVSGEDYNTLKDLENQELVVSAGFNPRKKLQYWEIV